MSYLKTKTTKKIILISLIIIFMWTSIEYGANNFTANAPPIPDEFNIENNLATASINSLQNYTMTTGYAYNWIDVSGGTELFLSDDDFSNESLPFDFQFYNETFSNIYLCSNGYLSFTYPTPISYINDPLPSGDIDNHYLIAPFWDDLRPYSGLGSGNITVQSFGTYWVAEWRNIIVWSAGPLVGTFEVVLHESGEIIFNYDYINYTGGGYTCGLNLGADVQYYNSYQGLTNLTDDFTILFTYEQPSGVFFDIVIDDLPGSLTNWSWAATQPWFGGGSGTPGAPYVIEGQTFKYLAGLACFSILNSRKHFIVDNCTIRNSLLGAVGLLLRNVTNGQILNSYILNSDTDGIRLSRTSGMLFSGNEIYNNSWSGIYSPSSENNMFIGNIFDNNGWYGVEIHNDTNLIYNNYFTNPNIGHAYDSGNNNDWNNTVIGNYWDDYIGYDMNLDGIGDDPYSIAGGAGNFDYLPIWDIKGPITINDFPGSLNNWTWAASQAWCSGSGTELDPYILEDLIVDGNLTDSCITILNSNAHFIIQGCTLNNSGVSDAGIYLNNVSNGNIIGNNLNNHQNAPIVCTLSDHNTVSGNSLNNFTHGIDIVGSYNEILDNKLYGAVSGTGIYIHGGLSNNIINGNIIENCYNGIWIEGANNNTVTENVISNNTGDGIVIFTNFNFLSGNKIVNNVLRGIYLIWADENTIKNTLISDNKQQGIRVEDSDDNIIYDNEIYENIITGVSISGSSDGNLFYQNYFINNVNHVLDNGANNDWNNTVIGNYWDNYTGYDMDLDGIGDDPYSIAGSAGNIDFLPIWDLQGPIAINDLPGSLNNWTWAASQPWCSGSGTELDPYIIKDLIIDGDGTDNCIMVINSNKHFIIRDCKVYNSGTVMYASGILLSNVTNSQLIGNNASNNEFYGITILDSDYNTISGNIVNHNTDYGIYLSDSNNNTISENIGMYNIFGLYAGYSDENTFSHNIFNNNTDIGLAVEFADNNKILENTVNFNTGMWGGIIVSQSVDTLVHGNTIIGNNPSGIGIVFGADRVNATRNIIKENTHGIDIFVGSDNNLIYENIFLENDIHAFDDGSNNDWNFTSIGNYWDNHTGPDVAPNDGIVDIPYSHIPGSAGSIDYLPIAEDGPPSIVINSPSASNVYGFNAPNFNVTISDSHLDKMWYTIDGGLHNYTFTGSTGTIDQSAWDTMADGIVTITFYASDIPGNIGTAEVNIEKDTQTPLVVINSPNTDDIFGVDAPSFVVEISDINLDSMWYSLDGGTTTFLFTTNGTINQAAWTALAEGTVTITFYANDTVGNLASESVNIEKDTQGPLIVINSPEDDDIFGNDAPSYNVTVTDPNLDSVWLVFEGVILNLNSPIVGTINDAVWLALPEGTYTITFYANDTVGHETSEAITITKSVPSSPGIGLDYFMTSFLIFIMGGMAIIIIIIRIHLKKRITTA